MSKRNMVKVGGFIGTLAAGAALVGSAVTGTGAYFTDSEDGSLTASSGHLRLNTTDAHLRFADLVPNEDKTKNIDFNIDATGKSDVWLTFDPRSAAVGQFTGAKGDPVYPDGGLGRFGHFAVSVNGGPALFQSYNLAHKGNNAGDSCGVDGNGNGGSTQRGVDRDDAPPYCGVPYAIRLASNLSHGAAATINLTFGVTGRWTGQDAFVSDVPFKVVATQVGVRPDAANF